MSLFGGKIGGFATMILSGSLMLTSMLACSNIKNGSGSSSNGTSSSSTAATGSAAVQYKTLESTWTPHYNKLMAYYQFTGTPNASIADQTNLGSVYGADAKYYNSGTVGPTTGYTSAPTDQGVTFDGSSNFIELDGANQNLSFDNTVSFTFMTWIKWTDTTSWTRVISNGDNSGPGWSVRLNPDDNNGSALPGHVYFGIGVNGGQSSQSIEMFTAHAFNDGQWHLLMISANEVSHKVSMYIDGAAVPVGMRTGSCGTISGNDLDFSACSNVDPSAQSWVQSTISGWSHSTYTSMIGSLSELAVFSVALSAAEVNTIYLHQR